MSEKPKIQIRKKKDVRQKPVHPIYRTFNDVKSAAINLARLIADDCGKDAPADVLRFIDEFGQKV